jgi:acetate kinase
VGGVVERRSPVEQPINSSMGLAPIKVLMMRTRSADIEPGIATCLCRAASIGVDKVESMLHKHSGLLGLASERDFRRMREVIESGYASA